MASNDGRNFGRPDVVTRLQVGCRSGQDQRQAEVAKLLDVGAVGDTVAEVVAHAV